MQTEDNQLEKMLDIVRNATCSVVITTIKNSFLWETTILVLEFLTFLDRNNCSNRVLDSHGDGWELFLQCIMRYFFQATRTHCVSQCYSEDFQSIMTNYIYHSTY